MEISVKQHPHYPFLWITEDGKVFRELVPSLDGAGYHQIRNGSLRERRHTLVAETYHGPRPTGQVVRHRDGVSGHDHYLNLEWGTQAENCADTAAHGKSTRGSKNARAKLSPEQVRQIRSRLSAGESGTAIARDFGLSQSTVCDIHTGRTWGHLKQGDDHE